MDNNTSKLNNPFSDIALLNYQWAYELVNNFTQLGIVHAVISPGSRSSPLALACERNPNLKTWIQIDERSAGFFGLGLSQTGLAHKQQATLLICTSGSAMTHWFPAVVEAEHSYTPLILLSADRPIELQHCGANQTINQQQLFGSHIIDFIALEHADKKLLEQDYLRKIVEKVYHKTQNPKPGVVHINIPFREPLLPSPTQIKEITPPNECKKNKLVFSFKEKTISKEKLATLQQILNSGNGLIICGRLTSNEQTDFPNTLAILAEKLNCPILLDPLSNLRFTKGLQAYAIYNYDLFLKSEDRTYSKIKLPEWVIRFGQFPVSKSLMQFLQALSSESILVNSFGDKLDPIHKTTLFFHSSPASFCKQVSKINFPPSLKTWITPFIQHWQEYDRKAENSILNSLECSKQEKNSALFEGHVINTLLKNIADKSLLFSGNSMAIRDFDTFITQSTSKGKSIDFYANRGTSGIDGNLSTFLGLLTNHNGYGVILLGDLSFYHDMNSLLICRELAKKGYNATIILINNSGGGIFNYLPQHQLSEFERLWNTDTQLDFQYSAKLYDLNYSKVESISELESKLPCAMLQPGFQLVEVIIKQKNSVKWHEKIMSL